MARRWNFVLVVNPALDIDGERLARLLKTKTMKMGVLKEYRRHTEFVPAGARRRLKSAKARRARRKVYTHDGQPLFLIERERQRYGD